MLLKSPTLDLPDPDQSSGRAVVIWDGHCNFCRKQVERLKGLDGGNRLAFISLHDPRVGERYPELSHQQLMDQMWLVTADRQLAGGADAVRRLTRLLPSLWLLAPFMHIPFAMPLWRYLYAVVARRRYRIAGENCDGGTCHLHVKKK